MGESRLRGGASARQALKIIYITAYAPFGPNEPFFVPEIAEWFRQGHELVLVPRTATGPIVHREVQGLEKNSLAAPLLCGKILGAAVAESFCHPLRVWRAARRILDPRHITMLPRNLLVFSKGLWIGRMARSLKAEHIHAHWATTTATMAMTAGEVSGIPWSFTAHRGDIATNNLLATKVARASFVRYISASGVKMAEALGVRHPPGKIAVIHMGVTVPASPAAPSAARQRPVLLCPANFLPVKGHQYLLRAMAILKDRGVACSLQLVGDGELEKPLRQLAAELALDDTVQFLGYRLHEEILGRYQEGAVDVVVLPSVDLGNHLHEGIPVSLMEAMAEGIPVVSTTTGGIGELLHDGAGLMVPPGDPAALAEALERLIRSPELRRQLGDAGRRRVSEEFSIERVVAQLATQIRAAGAREL